MNIAPAQAQRIEALQVEAVAKVSTLTAALVIIAATAMTVMFWSRDQGPILLGWLSASFGYAFALIADQRRLWPFDKLQDRRRLELVVVRAALLGAIWGLVPWILLDRASPGEQLTIGILIAGIAVAGASRLAVLPRAVHVYCWTLAGLSGAAFIEVHLSDPARVGNAVVPTLLLILMSASLTQHARAYADSLVSGWRQKMALEQTSETVTLLLNEFQADASDWLWECTVDGKLRHVSARMAEVAECSVDALEGRVLADLLMSAEADNAVAASAIKLGYPFKNLEVVLETGGRRRHWELSGRPMFDNEGRLVGLRGVGSDLTRRREAEARARHLADFDPVSGLSYSPRFQADVASALAELQRGQSAVVLRLGFDQFGSVSAALGPALTDVLRRQIAERLGEATGPQALIGWMGAGSFVVATVCAGRRADGRKEARAIIKAFSQPLIVDGEPIALDVKIGIGISRDADHSPDDLIRNATLAVAEAQALMSATPITFEPRLVESAQRKVSLEQALRNAIDRNELTLLYQPIVSLKSGKIESCEALLRWNSIELGPVSPVEFIPIAERSGLIVPIGDWVFREATRAAAQWPDGVRVAVNMSPTQFRGHRLLKTVVRALQHSGLAPSRLELEITESTLLDADSHALQLLHQLRLLGTRIALDDFGTGYSSLSYLRSLPLDKLKIDRSFVTPLNTDPVGAAVVKVIVDLAHVLGLETTAEGVESREQWQALGDLGCDTVQGFLFSAAAPAAEILKMIDAQGDMAAGPKTGVHGGAKDSKEPVAAAS